MAIDFPNSPSVNDSFTVGNRTWIWDGTTWELLTTASDPIQKTIVDAKGDLIVATAADTAGRLSVGTNEYRLVADSGESTGLKYVADTTNYAVGAKGDILAGTAADTLAALTVGSNGYVLTADSAETTGLKWAPGPSALTWAGNTVNTSQNTTSTTFTNLTTSGPAVTLTTGTNALVIIKCAVTGSPTGAIAFMGCQVSGSSSVSPSDDQAVELAYTHASNEPQVQAASMILYTGLTAGSNTFTAKYRGSSGSTVTFSHREMFVLDLGS